MGPSIIQCPASHKHSQVAFSRSNWVQRFCGAPAVLLFGLTIKYRYSSLPRPTTIILQNCGENRCPSASAYFSIFTVEALQRNVVTVEGEHHSLRSTFSCLTLSRVVVHAGKSLSHGHFYAYVLSSTGCWAKMDDDVVTKVRPAASLITAHGLSVAYEDEQYRPRLVLHGTGIAWSMSESIPTERLRRSLRATSPRMRPLFSPPSSLHRQPQQHICRSTSIRY